MDSSVKRVKVLDAEWKLVKITWYILLSIRTAVPVEPEFTTKIICHIANGFILGTRIIKGH